MGREGEEKNEVYDSFFLLVQAVCVLLYDGNITLVVFFFKCLRGEERGEVLLEKTYLIFVK